MRDTLHITNGDCAGHRVCEDRHSRGVCLFGATCWTKAPAIPDGPMKTPSTARAELLEPGNRRRVWRESMFWTRSKASTESSQPQQTMSGSSCGSTHACSINQCSFTFLRACFIRAF